MPPPVRKELSRSKLQRLPNVPVNQLCRRLTGLRRVERVFRVSVVRSSQPQWALGRMRIAWPPPGASITRRRVAEVTGRLVMVTGNGLSSQFALGPSA